MKTFSRKIAIAAVAFWLGIGSVWLAGEVWFLAPLLKSNNAGPEQVAAPGDVIPFVEPIGMENTNETVPAAVFSFKDYPVTKFYKGKNAKLKLTKDEKRSISGMKLHYTIENQQVDFAGYFIVGIWSCGMSCTWTAIIDARTGKVFGWNGILSPCFPDLDKDFSCNAEFSNVEYRIDSRLIVFFGHAFKDDRDETGVRGFHYYNFINGQLEHLKSVRVREQRGTSQIQLDSAETNSK